MIRDHGAESAFERLADTLSADLLGADEAEVLASHAGRAARVVADGLRQAIRRGAAEPGEGREVPDDLVRRLTMLQQREGKP